MPLPLPQGLPPISAGAASGTGGQFFDSQSSFGGITHNQGISTTTVLIVGLLVVGFVAFNAKN